MPTQLKPQTSEVNGRAWGARADGGVRVKVTFRCLLTQP